ncbi:MAG: alpha/beta hydrolase fold protein [Ilumatobacteraceae bacterium]|nr:alpha/beta hydrolase fold protein [Ilumatobacteraceae bacterium]
MIPSRDGTQIAGYELGGSGDVLLIAHATGMCGPMYQLLADELTPSLRVVAIDFRGHGNSGRADDYSWDRTAEDVNAVGHHLSADRLHGFGHSMGGASLLLAERNAPGTFTSLYLFEPIVFPGDAGSTSSDGQNMMAESARRRRPAFASRAEALLRYARKPPFAQIQAGCLAAYVENGMTEEADGTARLKCLPEVEAQIFENGQRSTLELVATQATPTIVAMGHDEPGANPARFAPSIAATLPNATLASYPYLGHFGPFQDPWTIGRDIRLHIAGQPLG